MPCDLVNHTIAPKTCPRCFGNKASMRQGVNHVFGPRLASEGNRPYMGIEIWPVYAYTPGQLAGRCASASRQPLARSMKEMNSPTVSISKKLAIMSGLDRVNRRGCRFPRCAAAIVRLAICDARGLLCWSQQRLAIHLGVSVRTVGRSIAWLRLQGFVSVRYRKRRTSQVRVEVGLLLAALTGAFEWIKRQLVRARPKALQARPLLADSTLRNYMIQAAPSAALLKTRLAREGVQTK